MKKSIVGGIVYFLLSAFFIPPSFASFVNGSFYVAPSDAVHKTINSVLTQIKNEMPSLNRNPIKIYVRNEGVPYKETINLDARVPKVELIGLADDFGNKPIIDGSLGVPNDLNAEENVINVVYKEKDAGSVHGFIIQGGIVGVKITASDLRLYDNEIRNNEKYGISISFGYAPAADDPDSDQDGIKNKADSCPNTLDGAVVNRNGCSDEQIVLLGGDSDNDGVPDGNALDGWIDRCPGTLQMPEDIPPLPDPDEPYVAVNVDGCPYGDIFDNDIHGNPEWNINVFTDKNNTEKNFLTWPLIRDNDIHDSNLGIAVRSELLDGDFAQSNLRPVIYGNKIYDLRGTGGPAGTLMGGITVTNNAYAKIINNDIGNYLFKVSRGISFNGGSGVVFGNDIHHSSDPGFGDGVSVGVDAFDVLIMNNRIYSNASNGVRFTAIRGVTRVINNTIDSNGSSGVIQAVSGGIVRNNIFSFNNGYGHQLNVASDTEASYNGFWRNKSGRYGGAGKDGVGDVGGEPLYVNGTPDIWDYHLLASSVFIDAGDPMDDCSDEPPTPGEPACRIDMGAYGNTAGATVPGNSVDDSDGDGTYDVDDRCPNTPTPTPAMLGYGCSVNQANGDADGDSVKNINDECRNTPLGVEVDLRGCPPSNEDSDNDGVVDHMDRCPDTLVGESGIVDAGGCGPSQQNVDSDGDGVRDPLDECMNTPGGVEVNDVGCPLSLLGDTDMDGVGGALDRCPDTSFSDLPLPVGGIGTPYGCSPNQLLDDDDGDAVFDYLDECPNTPPSTPVNIVGCSTFLSDFDGDGVTDDVDDCPATPEDERDNVDAMGCTPPQATGDGDGDNVQNGNDLCPGTNFGVLVGNDGCELPISDGDNDGVRDYFDRCPNTLPSDLPLPLGSVAGCAPRQLGADSDGDGVLDPFDLCPDSPAEVDANGCSLSSLDDDGDNVINRLDRCQGTASGDVVNPLGCSERQIAIDTDQDRVRDMLDRCPGTPPGSIVDAIGCINMAYNDADDDGVVDADDRCSDTPSGIPVDSAHGCSAEQMVDRDDDGDLVPNYRDECPNTPAGESVEDSSGCLTSILADISLEAYTFAGGGIELRWDRFNGKASDFKSYYIYRGETVDGLDLVAADLRAVLAPSMTWQGAIILSVLFGLGFIFMGKQRAMGVVIFIFAGILMTSVYIRANTVIDAANPLKKITDIDQTVYVDMSADSGVRYYYRVIVVGRGNDVYPTNIANHALFEVSGSDGNFIASTSPEAGAVDVSLNSPVIVAFDEAMDPSTINSSTVLLTKGAGIDVPGSVVYNPENMLLTYTPLESLEPAVTHTFTITIGVRNMTGASLPFDYRLTFMTELFSGTTSEERYFPLSWSGTLKDVSGDYMTMNFSMTSTSNISTGPTGGGGVGPGGAVGPGGNSLMTISGTFSDGTEVVGRVEYKCPGNASKCSADEALTDEYAIFISRSSGSALLANGTLQRVGEAWIASGAQWFDDRPVGWNMLFRSWSASPTQ